VLQHVVVTQRRNQVKRRRLPPPGKRKHAARCPRLSEIPSNEARVAMRSVPMCVQVCAQVRSTSASMRVRAWRCSALLAYGCYATVESKSYGRGRYSSAIQESVSNVILVSHVRRWAPLLMPLPSRGVV